MGWDQRGMIKRRKLGRHHCPFLSVNIQREGKFAVACLTRPSTPQWFEGGAVALLGSAFLHSALSWGMVYDAPPLSSSAAPAGGMRGAPEQEGGNQSEWWRMNFTSLVTVHTWDKFRRMLGHWEFLASHLKGKAVKYTWKLESND